MQNISGMCAGRVWECVQDASEMCTRRIGASIKPCDKAAATATPFFIRRGMYPECMQDAYGTCTGHVWDACEHYLGAELYCIP